MFISDTSEIIETYYDSVRVSLDPDVAMPIVFHTDSSDVIWHTVANALVDGRLFTIVLDGDLHSDSFCDCSISVLAINKNSGEAQWVLIYEINWTTIRLVPDFQDLLSRRPEVLLDFKTALEEFYRDCGATPEDFRIHNSLTPDWIYALKDMAL